MDRYLLHIGTLLNGGRYKIVRHLSSGGFGKTYVVEKVFHKGELYALKEFFIKGINERRGNAVIVSNDENKETFESQKTKFLTEAERLRDIDNEHIVSVHDFFSDNDTCYYVMDLIDGESLDAVKKPLKEEKVWDILNQVLDALSAIHQKKTIENKKERIWLHLDIKPANLMIDKEGKITLIDFGASKQLSASDSGWSVSVSLMPFTKGYAPIEQTSQRVDSIGPWTDFYALGATLYKLLTEKDSVIPEYSELAEILYSNDDITKAFKFPKDVSEKMRNLIVWMMNPNRKSRPQSVEEVRAFLNDSNDVGTENEPEEDNEVTIIVNVDSKKKKLLLIERIIKILKNKESYIRNINKRKIVGFIIILLVIVVSTLCFINLYIPYYNRLQLEYGERKKILGDIIRVDSLVNYYRRLQYAITADDNVYYSKVYYSKLGVVDYNMISDSLVELRFESKSFYDNYNPFEWDWHDWHSAPYDNRCDLPLGIFTGWVGHRSYKTYKTAKDSLSLFQSLHRYRGERPDIEFFDYDQRTKRYEDSVPNLSYKIVVKPFVKIDDYCGGTYVGPLINGQLGGKNAMFFLENGDVFVGEFQDNEFYRGTYLYHYGYDDNNDRDKPYYFVGSFRFNEPYEGKWYNWIGKRLLGYHKSN